MDPSAEPADEALMLRCRDRGDRIAFDILIHRYEWELYHYLLRYLRSPDLAEEVFQTAFLKAFQNRGQYQPERQFRPWLYRIATHEAIDALRRAGRRRMVSLDRIPAAGKTGDEHDALVKLLEAETPEPPAVADAKELREWTHEAVDALPESLRSVVLLVYFQGLKYHEAAEVLGIPVGTVKSRLHAALVKLNAAWRQKYAG
jgi:RNA polymerase sigma-70 factor (ECF subfamily)